jgi:hypothetical protein
MECTCSASIRANWEKIEAFSTGDYRQICVPSLSALRQNAAEGARPSVRYGHYRTHALQQKKSFEIPIFYRRETLSFRPDGHRAMRLQ